ncbi:MAG: hypothetical protein IJ962_00485 [Clostridia bacterium]|nr:hypothetical protein [Clostridia bacterium]MBR2417735.1 hypothetical protein [Clostridia bacterium]
MNINKEMNARLSLWERFFAAKHKYRAQHLALPLGELAKSKILTERAVPSTSFSLATQF